MTSAENPVCGRFAEIIKENFDDVYSIYVVNQFGTSKLTVEQQSHITETALESYNEFDYNDDTRCIVSLSFLSVWLDLQTAFEVYLFPYNYRWRI